MISEGEKGARRDKAPGPDEPGRLYGRRKGRPLRVRKGRLMEELLPRLEIRLAGGRGALDPRGLFEEAVGALWLEIGFGGGEHLAALAGQNPQVGFIGCEPFVNGVASLLDHIDRDSLKNIRIFPDDARLLLEAMPDNVIDRCFVLFPDPWPKARHAERRFIGPANLARLARVLAPGAELCLATDHMSLAAWMKACLGRADSFAGLQVSTIAPADWIPTRYEQKAIKAGRAPTYFSVRRRK